MYNETNVSILTVDKVPGWSPKMESNTFGNKIVYTLVINYYLSLKKDFYITESNMFRIPGHKPRYLNFGQSQTDFDSFLSCKY